MEGADGGALEVVLVQRMLLQLEEVALREGAERGGEPGDGQHQPRLVSLVPGQIVNILKPARSSPVSEGISNSIEPVQRDDD